MSKKMLINASDPEECRVALVDGSHLEEFYIEIFSQEQLKGNIYKARVGNIEPGLQACFVDFGVDSKGFLQIDEIHPEYFRLADYTRKELSKIQHVISPGQELLVQVVKEASGQKRPTLTTYLSLAGRYIVFMPGRLNSGISRKIEVEGERQRLKQFLDDLDLPEGIAIIIRTAAVGKPKRELTRDLKNTQRLWEEIKKRGQEASTPSLIYKEQDLTIRFIRDYFSPDIKEIVVDSKEVHRQILEFMKIISPRHRRIVRLYRGAEPIFSHYGVEAQIESIFEKQVSLKSGGKIVIDPVEALTAIDVNSGKATRESNMEQTALKTNMEAASEIARQIRLRDLAGLLVIDFIDMRESKNRKMVLKELKENLKWDRARIDMTGVSKFGLVELSRQRIAPPLQQIKYQVCAACKGRGIVISPEACALSFFRQIWHQVSKGNISHVNGVFAPQVASYLVNNKRQELLNLESRYDLSIWIEGNPELRPEEKKLEFIKKILPPPDASVQ
jgi:ribonuclease E